MLYVQISIHAYAIIVEAIRVHSPAIVMRFHSMLWTKRLVFTMYVNQFAYNQPTNNNYYDNNNGEQER